MIAADKVGLECGVANKSPLTIGYGDSDTCVELRALH